MILFSQKTKKIQEMYWTVNLLGEEFGFKINKKVIKKIMKNCRNKIINSLNTNTEKDTTVLNLGRTKQKAHQKQNSADQKNFFKKKNAVIIKQE